MKSLREITSLHHFDEFIKKDIEKLAAELSMKGNIRQSIECLRFLLDKEKEPLARSRIFVELAKNYRILLQMKNARYEINRAFEELGLTPPTNSLYSLIRSEIYRLRWRFKDMPHSWDRHMNDLYVELGLCGYYLRETLTMWQASIQARYFAFDSQDPLQLVNWYGGSACVYRLLQKKQKALRYLTEMKRIAEAHTGEVYAKSLLWNGLYQEYNNEIVASVDSFKKLFNEHYQDLSIYDLRLVAMTLAGQQMVRGKFEESLYIFTLPQFRNCILDGYYGLANSIDWSRIVGLMGTGQTEEAERIIADHQYVLAHSDEEGWALTMFIGQCLLAESMTTPRKDYVLSLIRRFDDLLIKPQKAYFEASFYWVGKSRSLFKLYQQERTPELAAMVEKSLDELSRAARTDYIIVHEQYLRAAWSKEIGKKAAYSEYRQRAVTLAKSAGSDWVNADLAREEYAMSA